MNTLLPIETRNSVLFKMAMLLERERQAITAINKTDLEAYKGDDISMFDRLKVENEVGVISQMAIKEVFQKKGIGAKILEELIIKSKENKVTKIELSARETVIELYKKFNFVSFGDKYASKKTGIIHQQMGLMIKYI